MILELQPGRVIKRNLWSSTLWTPEKADACGLHLNPNGPGVLAPIQGAASASDYLENKLLDHIFNDASYSAPTPYLGLWTAALTDASVGSAANEATYTGYARLAIAAADMSAAASGSKTNGNALTFAACTASTSTITYWGVLDNASTGAGNMLVWGTATSTVISSTQTPATIAASGLVVTLD